MPDNSSSIGFGLVVGFFVYITVRGELPAYLCVIGIGSNCPAIAASSAGGTGAVAPAGSNTVSTITVPSTSSNSTTIIQPITSGSTFGGSVMPNLGSGYTIQPGTVDSTITYGTPGDTTNTTDQSNLYCMDEFGNVISCG